MLVDYKGRTLKIGQRVRIEEDIPSENGMLYKHTIVKLDEINMEQKKIIKHFTQKTLMKEEPG